MIVELAITGDPWQDWGLAAFAQLCQENAKVFNPNLYQGGLRLNINDPTDAEELVVDYLRQLLDQIVMLPAEAKLLGYPRKRTKEGYFDPNQAWQLDKDEQEKTIDEFRKMYVAPYRAKEEKEQKYPEFKPNNRVQVSLRRNYPGLKKDWMKLLSNLANDVSAFFQQWTQGPLKDKSCSLCGRRSSTDYEMRQNKNPFYNQHHNNKTRGHSGSFIVNVMCPTCNFLNIFAAASADLPYFIEGHTHVLLPQVDDLRTLIDIRKLIRNNCLDMDDPKLISYRTNIRGLPYKQLDLFTSLTGVYWNLKYRFSNEQDKEFDEWSIGLPLEQQKQVERWVVFRYSKSQNVIFAHFNYLKIDNRLFTLLEKIKYGPEKDREGDLYRDILYRMPIGKSRDRGGFSQGLVSKDWHLVAQSMFGFLKQGQYIVSALLARFFDYALEVDKVLSEELLEDVKRVGTTLGRAFAKDIGMMSAINNVHDEDSLRKVLKDAFLKMHKIVATTSRFGGEEETWVPSPSRVENIIASVTRENVAAIRDTMLIYSTLAAMHGLRKKGGEEQQ